jgi:hypothetical protein
VRNENNLNLNLYTSVTGLDLHEINDSQYVNKDTRVVNFNFTPATHIVDQLGLRLIVDPDSSHSGLVGYTFTTVTPEGPAPPNWVDHISIYTTRLQTACTRKNIVYATKLAQIIAHELCHGNNVFHHGEGDAQIDVQADALHGLRSGDVGCVMRYDNTGTTIAGFRPEVIGSALCTSAAGTGYNAQGQHFGNAAAKRGNCTGQIRISGKNAGFPRR